MGGKERRYRRPVLRYLLFLFPASLYARSLLDEPASGVRLLAHSVTESELTEILVGDVRHFC
jgi:hypothetical protein